MVLLSISLAGAISRGSTLFEHETVWSIGLSALGFLIFHSCAMLSLHALGGTPAPQMWTASQLAKYLPAPGASLAGMVHSSVMRGRTPGSAIRLTLRHSAVLLAGAVVVGSLSVGRLTGERWSWSPLIAPAILIPIGILIGVVSVRGVAVARSELAILWSILAWGTLSVSLWAGIAHRQGDALAVTTAFAAAWAVGFLALPVPAGLGVREAMLLLLLRPWLGSSGAISFAVLSRVLHVASDAVVALMFLALPTIRKHHNPETEAT